MKKSRDKDFYYKIYKRLQIIGSACPIQTENGEEGLSRNQLSSYVSEFIKTQKTSIFTGELESQEEIFKKAFVKIAKNLKEIECHYVLVLAAMTLAENSIHSFNVFKNIFFKNESSKFFDLFIYKAISSREDKDYIDGMKMYFSSCSPSVFSRNSGIIISDIILMKNVPLLSAAIDFVAPPKNKRDLVWTNKIIELFGNQGILDHRDELEAVLNKMIEMEVGFNKVNSFRHFILNAPISCLERFTKKYKEKMKEGQSRLGLDDLLEDSITGLKYSKSHADTIPKFLFLLGQFQNDYSSYSRRKAVKENLIDYLIYNTSLFELKIEEVLLSINETPSWAKEYISKSDTIRVDIYTIYLDNIEKKQKMERIIHESPIEKRQRFSI